MITDMQHGHVCSALQDQRGLTGKATECVFSYAARGNIIFLLLCLFFLIIMPLLRHIACCVCIICVYTALA